ncbi:hypothetical protein DPMN_097770 [Dreissena polymorpha]|uniref:Uncharacterized protein n=1 Tax=Dreissena polymorpha TaxID=45954 RepID=A0A9D4LDW2_DREPO|nr:hypothetical protein DPMN_097770 [Dreissena polymorpha]
MRTDTAPILAATNSHAAATAQPRQTPRHVPHREAPMRTDTAPKLAATNNNAAATAQATKTLQHREAPMSTDTAPILAATNNQAEIQTQNTSHQIMPNIAPATSKDTPCRNGEHTDDHMQHPKETGSPKKLIGHYTRINENARRANAKDPAENNPIYKNDTATHAPIHDKSEEGNHVDQVKKSFMCMEQAAITTQSQ